MKLNLGCGIDVRDGYFNIDINFYDGVNMISDIGQLPFRDGTVEEIYASDVLEHFPWQKVRAVIQEWHRVLRTNGRLWIRTPNLRGLVELYYNRSEGWRREDGKERSVDPIVERLYGGQDNAYNFHYSIFDPRSISQLLNEEQFIIVEVVPDGDDISNLKVIAFKKMKSIEKYSKDYDCPNQNDCPILQRFLQRMETIDFYNEPHIKACADDPRFYDYQDFLAPYVCPQLTKLKEELQNTRITWESSTFGPSGYAFAARGYIMGLADLGTHVRTQPIWGDCKISFTKASEN